MCADYVITESAADKMQQTAKIRKETHGQAKKRRRGEEKETYIDVTLVDTGEHSCMLSSTT